MTDDRTGHGSGRSVAGEVGLEPLGFLAGVLCTLGGLVLILPWLRTIPGLGSLPALPWYAGGVALLTLAAVLIWRLWLPQPDFATRPLAVVPANASGTTVVTKAAPADTWAGIADALGGGAGSKGPMSPGAAQPMSSAIAALQSRLAKGGGSADDWELLARSYEFMGRSADASRARAHQLPPMTPQATGSPDTKVSK